MNGLSKTILLISYEFPPIIGGAGVYAHDLALGLQNEGHSVSVLTYHHKGDFERIVENLKKGGIKVYTIQNIRFIHFFQFFLRLRKILSQNTYDIVIFNDGRSKRIGALFQYFLDKILPQSISIMHGDEKNTMFLAPSLFQRLTGLKEKLISFFQKQRYVVVVSKKEYDIWSNSAIRNKLTLITHGIDIETFFLRTEEEANRIKQRFNVKDKEEIVLTASRLVKEKGQETIINCFPAILKAKPLARLYIVGSGPHEEVLKKKVESMGLGGFVRFLGGVDRVTLSALYAICDIFVLTSKFYESFGLVYIEAAACGQLSIAGNRGGTDDAVVDGVTGFLVNPEDEAEIIEKIVRVLSDSNLRQKLKQNAYDRAVKEFSHSTMSRKLVQTFFSIKNNTLDDNTKI